ncbi:hypothetical protein AB4Z46_27425 [Variovorax sp. M-6]|uniref:hypothetical protein n=1 Tax=Variovorax sp. M-6 TaxID=3233041 RepID=UPI003F993CF3
MVLDVDGKVLHATGAACRVAVQRQLCDYVLRRAIVSGVVPLAMPGGPHSVQFLRGVDTDIVLLFSASPIDPSDVIHPHQGDFQ